MRLTMPSKFTIPEQKFVPQADGTWLQVVYHPPICGKVYMIKHGLNGQPFHSWLDWSNQWWTIEPDADGNGTRELGSKIGITGDLYYVARIQS